MSELVSLLFIAVIRKLQIFPDTCLLSFFYNIGKLTSAASKERMTMNITFNNLIPNSVN